MNYIQPEWPAPFNVKAYITLKGLTADFASGENVDVDFRTYLNERIQSVIQPPKAPVWIKQIHSAIAVPASSRLFLQEGDAVFAAQPNFVCSVLSADCLPILLCNDSGTFVAAIHAGWRGLASGIIESTIASAKVDPQHLLAYLGPAISQDCYEVGIDVYEAFTKEDPQAKTAFLPKENNKWLADLYALARLRLQRLNVPEIYGGQFCTYQQPDVFYSYRREGRHPGRIASLIWFETL